MKKLIFFPIEIKSRELKVRLLMSLFALKKNFFCFIGDKHGIFRATKHFSPGSYFYKSINHKDTGHIQKIKDLKNNYIVLDEEGGFQYSTPKELNKFITVRSSSENVKLIDKFYTWGKFDHNEWKKRYCKYSDKFKLLGSPRIDLWKNKIVKKIYKNEISDISKKFNNNYILVVSSFMSSEKELKKYYKVFDHWFKFRNKKERQIQINQKKSDLALFKNFLIMINCISKDNPHLNFVIRPHPAENINDWRNFTKKMSKNIHISNEYDVTPWIFSSSFVIHNSSAVGMQTAGMKKKLITYRPKGFIYDRNFPNKFGIITDDKKKISKIINSKINLKNKKDLDFKKLKNRFCNINEDNLTSEKLINDINKSHTIYSKFNFVNFFFISFLYMGRDLLFLLIRKFVKIKQIKQKTLRSSAEKIPGGITKHEIEAFFKAMDDFDKKVKIIKFCNNCYLIYKN
jgi:surface carbohydrate biosynthesis protein